MDILASILVLVGSFLPLIGMGLTIILSTVTHGLARWLVLVFLPLVTLAISWLTAGYVWRDGNLLAAGLYTIYIVALMFYYPVLGVCGLVIYRERKRTEHMNDVAGTRP